MQKGPEMGGLTRPDSENGHSGCESLERRMGVSELGILHQCRCSFTFHFSPSIGFSVGGLHG